MLKKTRVDQYLKRIESNNLKIIRGVGLRNLFVHDYGNLDLKRVYKIFQDDIDDLKEYIAAILKRCGLEWILNHEEVHLTDPVILLNMQGNIEYESHE